MSIQNKILNLLDFIDFDICNKCMKGERANRTLDVLELIHTNVCGPFPTVAWNDQQNFITLIDNFLRYDYIYLVHEKAKSL
uniref:Uncharacterized protein n=1 Tax=Cajanus cajan TaxID=3821 RepID=A0A151U5L0_CAJCA|nr:hypothetical protein KK1_007254 [Cajanus cajan]